MKSGNPNFLEPSGPLRACKGTALPLLLHIKYLDKKKKREGAKDVYKEVKSIKKELNPQTLLIIDKEGNILSNKQKVLQRWSKYCEKNFELQDGADNDSGEVWRRCTQTPEQYVNLI